MNIILRLAALCKFELLICSEKISSLHSLLRCYSLAQINFRIVRCFAVAHFVRQKFGSLRSLAVPMLTCYSLRFRQNCRFTSSNSGSMASLVISTFRRCAARLERQRQADNSYNIAPVKAGTAPRVWGRRRECRQQTNKL